MASRSAVSGLLAGRCPPTIARLVMAVHVDAIDRMLLRWARAHVGKKGVEREPAITDSNASTAVVGVALGGQGRAALHHSAPRHVSRRHLARGPRPRPYGDSANPVAATRLNRPRQVPQGTMDKISAVAAKQPKRGPAPRPNALDRNKAVEPAPRKVDVLSTTRIRTNERSRAHVATSEKKLIGSLPKATAAPPAPR